jgi:hypothetical protein
MSFARAHVELNNVLLELSRAKQWFLLSMKS